MSEDFGGSLGSVRVRGEVSGEEIAQSAFDARGVSTAFPREIEMTSSPGAELRVTVNGYFEPMENVQGFTVPIVTRTARVAVPGAGQKRLLRLSLEPRCVSSLPLPPPGWTAGPVCGDPVTCIAGRCVDDRVAPEALETYRPGWPDDTPDICRPAGGGAPEIVLGTGQTDYLPLSSGQTLQLERGPQGGHHIWMAVRMKNLKQTGTMTTLSAAQPESTVTVQPTAFVFTFDRDEGGYCKLYGLRFQLDTGGNAPQVFLDKPLDVKVEAVDRTGAKASATIRVQIAKTILQ